MASERALLIIADIGGYTDYMGTHRMSLAHAEVNTARLLEAVVDAAPEFELIEIEGDAAFLSRNADTLHNGGPVVAVTQAAAGMHRAFHVERRNVVTNLCPCDGCSQAENLRLKFVAHIGEVASQRIRDRRKLVGIDVIHVHRLLKNPVEAPEYVLLSEEVYRTGEAALPDPVHEVSQNLEGIGLVRAYFVDIEDLAGSLPPLPDPSSQARRHLLRRPAERAVGSVSGRGTSRATQAHHVRQVAATTCRLLRRRLSLLQFPLSGVGCRLRGDDPACPCSTLVFVCLAVSAVRPRSPSVRTLQPTGPLAWRAVRAARRSPRAFRIWRSQRWRRRRRQICCIRVAPVMSWCRSPTRIPFP